MRTIDVVYSPLCEATGAMLGKLTQWLEGTDVQINAIPFNLCPQRLRKKFEKGENCFIDVFYGAERIDTVPLHQERVFAALGIKKEIEESDEERDAILVSFTPAQLIDKFKSEEIRFIPICQNNYLEEMSMCLCNYPFGNPPKQYHKNCVALKSQVFSEVWQMEEVAGIYAKYKETVIGLLEVMPREILKKYGYMTGTSGSDSKYLSVGCYEIGYGIPRVEMIDLLMNQLETIYPLFHRKQIEGVGVHGWDDGFNPYWVYKKYGFQEIEKLSESTVVMSKSIV